MLTRERTTDYGTTDHRTKGNAETLPPESGERRGQGGMGGTPIWWF